MITTNKLCDAIAQRTGFRKQNVRECINCMTDVVTRSLAQGEDVHITKLGTFSTFTYKEKPWYDPKSGETKIIEEHLIPRFRTSSILKKAVRGTLDKFPFGGYGCEDD